MLTVKINFFLSNYSKAITWRIRKGQVMIRRVREMKKKKKRERISRLKFTEHKN